MHSQQHFVGHPEHELHQAIRESRDPGLWVRTEGRSTYLVFDPRCARLLLREADPGGLGNGEHVGWPKSIGLLFILEAEGVANRNPCLLHRRGRETERADHIAGGKHSGSGGSVTVVDLNPAAGVGLDSGFRECQAFDLRPPAYGDQDLPYPERAAIEGLALAEAGVETDSGGWV